MKLVDMVKGEKRILSAPLSGYPTVHYIGESVEAGVRTAEVQIRALKAYYEAARPDILLPFMDLSVEAEALGLPVRFKAEDGPDVTEHPVKSPEDLQGFSIPEVPQAGRYGVFLRTVRALKAETEAKVGAYVASPFTLAGLMMGAESLTLNTMLEPDFCRRVIDFTCSVCIPYAKALEEAGADFIVLLEPTAALLSPTFYEDFVGPAVQRVVDRLMVPAVLHVCGQTGGLVPSFVKNSVQGLSLDSDVNLAELAPMIPDDVVIIGNVSPVEVMLNMDAEGVYRETTDMLEHAKGLKYYIASTGCDVPPGTKRENLEAFNRAVRDYNRLRSRAE